MTILRLILMLTAFVLMAIRRGVVRGDHPLLGLYLCIVFFSYHPPPLLPYLYSVSLALVILVPLMMKYQLTSKILAKNTFLHTSTVTLHSVIISKYNYTDLYLR